MVQTPDAAAFVQKLFKFFFWPTQLGETICDRLQENRAQRGVRKYLEKIDQFLKNVLFQADGRERLGLL